MKTSLILCLLTLLSSCVGYQLNGKRPSHLTAVRSLSVPLAQNRTLFPRAEVTCTNSLIDALTLDGTYNIRSLAQADASLLVTLREIKYSQVRSAEDDTLRSEELEMRVFLTWQLISNTTRQELDSGLANGHTRFFAGGNLQTARNEALPDAMMRASQTIVSRIADGF